MKFGEVWVANLVTRVKLEKLMLEIMAKTPNYKYNVGELPILATVDDKVEAWHSYLDRDEY